MHICKKSSTFAAEIEDKPKRIINLNAFFHFFFVLLIDLSYAKIVDRNLNTVVPFAYDGLYQLTYINEYRSLEEYDENGNVKPFTPQFWRYDVGMNSGVLDRHGNVIIPAMYYMVRMVDEDIFEVEVSCGGDRILFDRKGRYVGKSNF